MTYVTERAVFRVGPKGLELAEVAPGIDIERDILAQMDFHPHLADDLCKMDARLFLPAPMSLAADIAARPVQTGPARLRNWGREQ